MSSSIRLIRNWHLNPSVFECHRLSRTNTELSSNKMFRINSQSWPEFRPWPRLFTKLQLRNLSPDTLFRANDDDICWRSDPPWRLRGATCHVQNQSMSIVMRVQEAGWTCCCILTGTEAGLETGEVMCTSSGFWKSRSYAMKSTHSAHKTFLAECNKSTTFFQYPEKSW